MYAGCCRFLYCKLIGELSSVLYGENATPFELQGKRWNLIAVIKKEVRRRQRNVRKIVAIRFTKKARSDLRRRVPT